MKTFILVPTDFTKAANTALKYAVNTAEKTGAKIYLLNVCKSVKKLDVSIKKLEKQSDLVSESNVEIENVARVGDFKDIPVIAEELFAEIIFMGTHGVKGMQKIMGSNALRLVTKSKIPFIIVQKGSPLPAVYKKIMVPTSFHYENKQKITVVGEIAEYFNSKICFIYNTSDDRIKAKSLLNLQGMKNYLNKKNISFEVETSENKDFNADTLDVVSKVGADLIAIMNMQKDDVIGSGIFGQNFEQELIMNDQKIPVMIISPKFTRIGGPKM